MAMADHTEDNDPFEEDIVFDEAGLLGGKIPRSRQQVTAGFLPTFMLFIRTVCLCIAFLALGMCVSVSGGPLIKLELGTGESVNMAFQTFTAHSVGMLIGAFLGSVLFEVYNRQFLMFVSLVWVAVSVTVLPFTVPTAFWWTFFTTTALGMGLGFLFTGGNVMCLDLWGRQGGASLQALHFSFAVGAFIVPLVIQPFFVGLHPAELHNSSTSRFSPPFTTQLSRLVRDIESQITTSEAPPNMSTFSVDSMSDEALQHLTLPNSNVSKEKSAQSKNMLTLTLPDVDLTYTMHYPETTVLVTTAVSSTTRPAKKKPQYTNGNKLDSDVPQKWKKTSNTKAKYPPISENETEHSQDVPTTSAQPPNTQPPSATTESEVTETEPIIPQDTTQKTVNYISGSTISEGAVITEIENYSTQRSPTLVHSTSATKSTTSSTSPRIPTVIASSSIITSSTVSTQTISSSTLPTTATTSPTTVRPPFITITVAPNKPITLIPEQVKEQTDDVVYLGNGNKAQTLLDHSIMNDSERQVHEGDFIPEPKVQHVKESFDVTHEEADVVSTPSSAHHSSKPGTYSNRSDESSNYLDDMAQRFKDYGLTKVHLAYICIGIFIILNALISVVILCHNPRETRSKQDDGNMSKIRRSRIIVFTVIFSVFMFMAEALQGSVHHLLASSAADSGLDIIQERKIDGQALFWGLVCLVRFLCTLLSGCLRVKPGKLLIAAVLFSFIGSVFIAIGSFGKEDFIWGGVVFLALGLAPILPTSLLWMAQYMRVTHRMCALMIVLASFGNSLAHSLLTQVASSSHMYAYIMVTESFVSLFFLLMSICVIYSSQHSKSLGVPVGYHLARQHEEEDSIELTPSGSAVFTPHDTRLSENGEAGQSLLID